MQRRCCRFIPAALKVIKGFNFWRKEQSDRIAEVHIFTIVSYSEECSITRWLKTPKRNKRWTCCDRDVQHNVNQCNSQWYFLNFVGSLFNIIIPNEFSINQPNNQIHEITSQQNCEKNDNSQKLLLANFNDSTVMVHVHSIP